MGALSYAVRPLGTWTDPVTPPGERRSRWTFKASWSDTLSVLAREIAMVGGSDVVMQLDVRESDLRKDGGVRANANVGNFPGVRISFRSVYGPLTYATDAHESWQHNVRAIALALGALRAVDRYGVSRRGEQYRGWTAITATPEPMTVDIAIGLLAEWSGLAISEVKTSPVLAWRAAAKKAHPDITHDDGDTMARLNAARDLLTGGAR